MFCYAKCKQDQPDFQMNCSTSTLAEAHVVLVCVNASDTERTVTLLKTLLPGPTKDSHPIGVFSLQHGCSNYDKIETGLQRNTNLCLIDGSVGFHVVRGRADGALKPLMPGQLVLERLNKEKADKGIKFVNLL